MKSQNDIKKIVSRIFDFMDKKPYAVTALLIIGMILVAEGFIFIYSTLNHWFSHISLLILFGLFFTGFICLILVFFYTRSRGSRIERIKGYEEMAPYLKKLDRYFPISNRYVSIAIGTFIIFFAWFHNIVGIGGTSVIGDTDVLLILTGLFFIAYPFIPSKYHLERDFILTFLVLLVLFMGIVPFLFDEFGSFKYYFLTLPVHHMLDLIGVPNRILTPDRIGYPHNKIWGAIIIARSCSGIYSFSIFSSAFIAFALVVYRKLDVKVILFLILGILLAYFGNIIRMTIVIASGHYYGAQTMMWVHENVGYIIFFAWMGFFWFLLYKFLLKEPKNKDKTPEE